MITKRKVHTRRPVPASARTKATWTRSRKATCWTWPCCLWKVRQREEVVALVARGSSRPAGTAQAAQQATSCWRSVTTTSPWSARTVSAASTSSSRAAAKSSTEKTAAGPRTSPVATSLARASSSRSSASSSSATSRPKATRSSACSSRRRTSGRYLSSNS